MSCICRSHYAEADDHTYSADYYAQRMTFSISHSRSAWLDCGGYINDSILYTANWYPSDNLRFYFVGQEGGTTRYIHAGTQKRWQTDYGSVELAGYLAQSQETWSIGVSFRPGDNKSMLRAHRSIFDSAPVFSINHLENSNGYRNSSFSISYSF